MEMNIRSEGYWSDRRAMKSSYNRRHLAERKVISKKMKGEKALHRAAPQTNWSTSIYTHMYTIKLGLYSLYW